MREPFGPPVQNNTAVWISEPNARGSWSILTSSLITIGLCAWTALHLNIPEQGSKIQWLRKTKWFILGLVAPETVAYTAWRQRSEAARLAGDVGPMMTRSGVKKRWSRPWLWNSSKRTTSENDKVRDSPSLVTEVAVEPEWTLTHGFYASMGGFALDSNKDPDPFLPQGRTRVVLTPAGIRFVHEHAPHILPYLSKADIEDKSKADGLKKFLVCAQGVWFCVSSITRLVKGLPISLLELNAMAHALCALLIYCFWWSKPLDINEPTVIRGEDGLAEDLLAYLWMGSRVSVRAEQWSGLDIHGRIRDEFDALWPFEYPNIADLLFPRPQSCDHGSAPRQALSTSMFPQPDNALDPIAYPRNFRHYSEKAPLNLQYRLVNYLQRKPRSQPRTLLLNLRFPPGLGTRKTAISHLHPRLLSRWRRAHAAIIRHDLQPDLLARHTYRPTTFPLASDRVASRISDHASLFGSRPLDIWTGFAAAGILYGGIHLLAWNAPFTSPAELVLWRFSACCIAGVPLVLGPLVAWIEVPLLKGGVGALFGYGPSSKKWREKGLGPPSADGADGGVPPDPSPIRTRMKVAKEKALHLIVVSATAGALGIVLIGPLLWFGYCFARVFLVVESFINLAHLSADVFRTVDWPGYVPHIA